MTEIVVLARKFAQELAAAADLLDAAKGAEARVAAARRDSAALKDAAERQKKALIEERANHNAQLAKEKAAFAAAIDRTKAAHDAEKGDHDRHVENARGQVDTASRRLQALNNEVAAMTATRDAVSGMGTEGNSHLAGR